MTASFYFSCLNADGGAMQRQKKPLQAAYFIWDILFDLKHLFDFSEKWDVKH